jgi:Hepatocellular carcinoma-associated antigen 59
LEGQRDKINDHNLSASVIPGSTGIAEVALPSYFKEKNIKETENARQILEEKMGNNEYESFYLNFFD